jgi:hypothetical protein
MNEDKDFTIFVFKFLLFALVLILLVLFFCSVASINNLKIENTKLKTEIEIRERYDAKMFENNTQK